MSNQKKSNLTLIERSDISLAEQKLLDQKEIQSRGKSSQTFRESRIKIPEEIESRIVWKDISNKKYEAEILDISKYGCRIKIEKKEFEFNLFTRFTRGQIFIDDLMAYTGPITFVNESDLDDSYLSVGITLENKGCDLDALSAAGTKSVGISKDIDESKELLNQVSPEFKILIADLNFIFQDIYKKLLLEENKIDELSQNENHKKRLEERVINLTLSIYRPTIQNILLKFQNLTENLSMDEEIVFKRFFRTNFIVLMEGTPFVNRGLRKPLGYSGDYGMMVMLYEYIDQGHSLFHKFFHRYVCSEPTALANRNRVEFLSDLLIENYVKKVKAGVKDFKIVSLACGPAREIFEFLKHAPLTEDTRVEVILIDAEVHALDFAQKRIKELPELNKIADVRLMNEDVVTGTFQNQGFLEAISEADVIVSAGLFDYLTERVSRKMVTNLFSCLKKGGQILIGNIAKDSPDVFAMDYLMDWRLILRDEQDLLAMVSEEIEGQGARGSVIAEAIGLNLFLKVERD